MMMFKNSFKIVFVGLLFWACTNLDSVSPSNRDSFVHYYGGLGNYEMVTAEPTSDGYLIVGDSVTANSIGIVVIKTDLHGQTMWRRLIDNASANAIKKTDLGYLIIGDSIYIDLSQSLIIDQVKRKMRLISLNSLGHVLADKSWGDTATQAAKRVDKRGSAVAIDIKGSIICTSTVNFPKNAQNQYTLLSSHDPGTLKMKWSVQYNQDSRDYQNSPSLFISGTDVVWSTSALKTTAQTVQSFVRLPIFQEDSIYSTYINSASFGENEVNTYYSGSDIQPNFNGYGVAGTYQTYKGENSNVFFLRTDKNGNPIDGSDRYFDGLSLSTKDQPISDKTQSQTQDQGIALTATHDGGYVIAGFTTSTNDGKWGNGGKDILLIRLDEFGNILWHRTFGGSGDEVPTRVRATTDGGLIVAGTLTLAGQSSMFIMKTDASGQLKN